MSDALNAAVPVEVARRVFRGVVARKHETGAVSVDWEPVDGPVPTYRLVPTAEFSAADQRRLRPGAVVEREVVIEDWPDGTRHRWSCTRVVADDGEVAG